MEVKKLVVFDLDGTLNRTELFSVPAHQKLLHEMGIYDKTEEDIISTFGARAQEAVPFLTGNTDPAFVPVYMKRSGEYEEEFIQEKAAYYDGVLDMLVALREKGYLTAICSNSSTRYITMVLKRLGLLEYIDFIQPLVPDMQKDDTLRLLLEQVAPEKAVMVGDRFYDKMAARANRIPFIGCLYGFRPDEVADADAPVTSAADIPLAVDSLIG